MMKKPIYLDYNATTPIDPEVANEMKPFMNSLFGNPSSSYSIGRTTKEAISKARSQVAALINARSEEIIFTSCATESNNLAIHGFVLANKDRKESISLLQR
ncbi:MAG: aminotransferase class V-fold PLP-dependent enzyme [Cyclobacteriaceae bacterium]|nr:aminotransferase class V-fold PLP-dependent enzyme [Cyclobacteriaceae bacterium]